MYVTMFARMLYLSICAYVHILVCKFVYMHYACIRIGVFTGLPGSSLKNEPVHA